MQYRIIAVLAVIVLAGCSTAQKTAGGDNIFRPLALKLSTAGERMKAKTVAVYGFGVIGKGDDAYSRYATEKLTHELVDAGKLTVIERSRIDEILKEQNFTLTGMVDSVKAAKIGKILSVEGVVIGTIAIRNNEVEYIVRVVQSENAIILASASETKAITPENILSAGVSEQTSTTAATTAASSMDAVLDKSSYRKGDTITVRLSGMPGNPYDWLTLVDASASDSTYGEWFYTDGKKDGSFSFPAVKPGAYELRVYFDWPNGGYVVQKRVKITVK